MTHRFASLLSSLVASALLLLAAAPFAAAVTITASDSGWHSDSGEHTASNENYAAGWSNQELRNFFVFDLSSQPSNSIASVVFRAYNPDVGEPDVTFAGGYSSDDATETYNLREVALPAATVTAPSAVSTVVYDELGSGTLFGSHVASDLDNGQFIEIALNAAGIAAVEAALGFDFVLGGHVSSLDSNFGEVEIVFGDTDPPGLGPYTRELVITFVPEPGTASLLALGLAGLATARRRHHV